MNSGSKYLKTAKNKFSDSLDVIFTNFSKQISEDPLNLRFRSFQAIHIQNLSNRCRHKYDCVNFTTFSNLTFCRVFCSLAQLCSGGAFTYIPGLRFKLASSSAFLLLLLLSKSLTEAAIRVWSVLALQHLKF